MQLRLHKTMRKGKRRGGFTLIELLVVIGIIGILAAVVLVSLNAARVRGRDGRRLSDLQNISIAMEIFFDQNNFYPNVGAGNNGTSPNNTAYLAIEGELITAGLIPDNAIDPRAASRLYMAQTDTDTADTAGSFILGADLEQNNVACATDYDGLDLDGTGSSCAETADGICDGLESGTEPNSTDPDFCIIQQQ